MRELVAEAEAAARAAEPAPDAAPLVTPDQAGVGSDFALEPETTSVGAFAQVAADLGEAFAAGGADRQHFGFAEQVVDSVYLGTSTGLRLRHVQPTGRLEMNAKNADWSASSYLAFTLRDPAEADVAAADADLARRLGWAERRLDLPAGRYETILPPSALADLLVEAYWESGARAADEGRSAYSGKLGERLSRLPLELFSDPTRPGLECAPFVVAAASTADTSVFDNGLPLPRQDVLAQGELVSLTGSRAYAASHETPIRLESRQPRARGAWSDRRPRRPRRLDAARAAALDGLVRPRRRPADPPAHRAHPRRRLPRRGRRGRRCGQQLPVERVAAGRARPHHRGRAPPSAATRGSGATTSRGRRCRRSGWPTST